MYRDTLVMPPRYCADIDTETAQYNIRPDGSTVSSIAHLMLTHDQDVKDYYKSHRYDLGWYITCMRQWEQPERMAKYFEAFKASHYKPSTLVGLIAPHLGDKDLLSIAQYMDMCVKKCNIAKVFKHLD